MSDRWRNLGAGITVTGGLLLFIGSMPPTWFGYEQGDSYLFDPAVFSPIWIERVLLPVLVLVGSVGLLIGIAGLVYRDWQESRLLRWAGPTSIVGAIALLAGIYGPDLLTTADTTVGPIPALAGLALAIWGLLLLLVGGPLLAYAYLRIEKRRLGWALLSFIPAGILLGWVFPEGLGELAGAVPWLVLAFVIAMELRD